MDKSRHGCFGKCCSEEEFWEWANNQQRQSQDDSHKINLTTLSMNHAPNCLVKKLILYKLIKTWLPPIPGCFQRWHPHLRSVVPKFQLMAVWSSSNRCYGRQCQQLATLSAYIFLERYYCCLLPPTSAVTIYHPQTQPHLLAKALRTRLLNQVWQM